jgi:hypothetical protein
MPERRAAPETAAPETAETPMRSSRQIVLLGAALAALALAGGGAAAQPGAIDGKLRGESEHLAASGFERIGGDTVAAARKDEPSVFPVELEGGVTYAVVAACGDGCGHVEIALFDPGQSLLTRSPETSDVVIVSGPAQQGGVHGIALSVPGCRKAACPAGFVLLRQAWPAGPAGASAAPADPPSAQISAALPPPHSPAAPGAGPESEQLLGELAKLAVTAREAARARERRAMPVVAPAATDAQSAPGRPPPSAKPAATRPRGSQATPPAPLGRGQHLAGQLPARQTSPREAP